MHNLLNLTSFVPVRKNAIVAVSPNANTFSVPAAKKKMSLEQKFMIAGFIICTCICLIFLINPAFAAANYKTDITDILEEMVDIICTIFVAVGIILSVYAVGTMVLAFKNEDADSKSRSATMLVVGICLIALPSIVSSLDLVSKLT